MSKKVIFPLLAVFTFGLAAGSVGCHAEAQIGNAEPKVATPPPPPPPAPPKEEPKPEPAAPAPKALRVLGKAKIEKDEIKIPGKIHFDTGKPTLKEDKETKEILQTVADVLKENPSITKLRIEGHTDDTGGPEDNQKLSQGRAASVVEWLAKNGVDKARLDAKGWGEDRPLVKNDTPANKEQNRRVEFKLWELDGKATDVAKAESANGSSVAAKADDAKKDAKPASTTPAPAKK